MSITQHHAQPWIDTSTYPFHHHYIQLSAGQMHYVDEGQGDVILFVHGTPTWSYLYRAYIKDLSKDYRCIAIDHIGFGLSDKPVSFEGTPQKHAENLKEFIQKLNLNQVTLVVHDFGGPIGISTAISLPDRIKNIVMFNTWLWETRSNPEVTKINKMLHSGLGKFLYLNMNFSPKVLLKKGFSDKKKLTKKIHRHYIKPFPTKDSRRSLLKIGKSLAGSSDWYQQQWGKLNQIDKKPWLILWGMKDTFIKPNYLNKWKKRLPNVQVEKIDSGHFVQEEKPTQTIQYIREFLKKQ